MERVAGGRTAGLQLLLFVHVHISPKENLLTPVLSFSVSAFRGGHEILRSSQASRQI